MIQGVGASGVVIPLYIIFAGKNHINTWYDHNTTILAGWVLGVSDSGWTTNSYGIEWLRHFDRHTRACTIGSHHLLLIDGHESHCSLEFQRFCEEAKIITLCMPHSSHLLQPLDVGCFGPLKRAYGGEIAGMACNTVTHITKSDFLAAFQKAYSKAITPENVRGSFRGAGLIPFNPEAVISRFNIRVRTPTPEVQLGPAPPQTPRNAMNLQSQSTQIRERLRRHQDSSPASIIASLDRFTRGAKQMAHSAVLIRNRAASLQQIAEAATNRKVRKRRYIQREGSSYDCGGPAIGRGGCRLGRGGRKGGSEEASR